MSDAVPLSTAWKNLQILRDDHLVLRKNGAFWALVAGNLAVVFVNVISGSLLLGMSNRFLRGEQPSVADRLVRYWAWFIIVASSIVTAMLMAMLAVHLLLEAQEDQHP